MTNVIGNPCCGCSPERLDPVIAGAVADERDDTPPGRSECGADRCRQAVAEAPARRSEVRPGPQQLEVVQHRMQSMGLPRREWRRAGMTARSVSRSAAIEIVWGTEDPLPLAWVRCAKSALNATCGSMA